MSQLEKRFFNFFRISCFLFIAVFFDPNKLTADATPDILTDYFWGTPEMRTNDKALPIPPPPLKPKQPQTLSCDSEILQIICFNKCGEDYICEKTECKCAVNGEALKVTLRFAEENNIVNDNKYLIPDENDLPPALRSAIENEPLPPPKIELEDLLAAPPRPALRHHIAHFCSSIKRAKICIRTCMKQGLPAFCGKDHVCYCGHRYSSHDDKNKVDVNDVYMQFRDLYEKYFGPKIFEQGESSDEEEE